MNGCTLFHFFNPAAQNKVDYYASLKGWVQIGQTFTNDVYMGSEFSLAFDSHEIPHLFFTTTSNNDTLFRFNGDWVVENEFTNYQYNYKTVLRFDGDNPYVAIKDNAYTLTVYDYSSEYPHALTSYIALNIDTFDFNISPSGKLAVNFATNNGAMYYIQIRTWDGGAWVLPSPFPLQDTASYVSSLYLEFYGERIYSFMCMDTNTLIDFDKGTGFSISSVNCSPLLAKIAGNKIFYIYNTGEPNVYFHIEDVTSAGYSTNLSTLLRTNSYALPDCPTLTGTGTSPYKAYCILSDITATNYIVAEITEDNQVRFLGNVPVHGNYNFGLYATPYGALYLVAANVFPGSESLQVFRYFE
jgi:hypothetical protein